MVSMPVISTSCMKSGCCAVLQEDQQDSQLINSVYLDNSSMELYHGRLDKRPNAIAIRIRCCPSSASVSVICY